MGDHHYQLSQSIIDADLKALDALALLPDYQPANPAYSREALLLLRQTFMQAEMNAEQLDEAFELARYARTQGYDVRNTTAQQVHEAVLGFKDQVVAQYGKDSRAVELVGYIRKSERRRPNRRKAAAAAD
jgi:hypothetical protein